MEQKKAKPLFKSAVLRLFSATQNESTVRSNESNPFKVKFIKADSNKQISTTFANFIIVGRHCCAKNRSYAQDP